MMKLRMKNLARRLIRVFREYKQRKLDKYNQLAKTDKKKKDGVKFVDPEVEEVAFHIRVMNAEVDEYFKMSK